MLPLQLSCRRMLRKYIPQISVQHIEEFESLLALTHQVHLERSVLPPKRKSNDFSNYVDCMDRIIHTIKDKIRQIGKKATPDTEEGILVKHVKEIGAVYTLWVAQRQYAIELGQFLQIPTTFQSLGRLLKKALAYRIVHFKTMPVLIKNRFTYILRHRSWIKVITAFVLAFIIIISLISSRNYFSKLKEDVDDQHVDSVYVDQSGIQL